LCRYVGISNDKQKGNLSYNGNTSHWEQNEKLGLNDMKVEGYEEDVSVEKNGEKAG